MIEGLVKVKEVFYDILTAELLSKTIVSHCIVGVRHVDDLIMRERPLPLPLSMTQFSPMVEHQFPVLTADVEQLNKSPVEKCAQWMLDNGKDLSEARKMIKNEMWKICFKDHKTDHSAIAKRLGVSAQYVALQKKKIK